MSQRFKIILDTKDHHDSEIMGRFKAKYIAKKQYGETVELLGETKGPAEGDITYSFIQKQMQKEDVV